MFKLTSISGGTLALGNGLAPGQSIVVSELSLMMVYLKNNGAIRISRIHQEPQSQLKPSPVLRQEPVAASALAPESSIPSSRTRRSRQTPSTSITGDE